MTASKQRLPQGERPPQKVPPRQRDETDSYDETVAETFPASDPPSSSGIIGPGRAGAEDEQK